MANTNDKNESKTAKNTADQKETKGESAKGSANKGADSKGTESKTSGGDKKH